MQKEQSAKSSVWEARKRFEQEYGPLNEEFDLPKSFVNHRVEILIPTLDDAQPVNSGKKRAPPPQFAGRVKELGDVMSSVPPADWES